MSALSPEIKTMARSNNKWLNFQLPVKKGYLVIMSVFQRRMKLSLSFVKGDLKDERELHEVK